KLVDGIEVELRTGAPGRFRAGDDVCEVDHVSAPFGLGDGVSTGCTRRTTRLQTYPVPPADRPPSIPISSRHDGLRRTRRLPGASLCYLPLDVSGRETPVYHAVDARIASHLVYLRVVGVVSRLFSHDAQTHPHIHGRL